MDQIGPVSVLISPLDWGLGHATRCIPIINELIQLGARVTIAAGASQRPIFNQAFPQLECLEIPGYKVRYKPGILLKWGLIFSIPAMLYQIRKEKKWLKDLLQKRKIDLVISDNRYGLYNENCLCIFMTHQLYLQSGIGVNSKAGSMLRFIGRRINLKIMNWNYHFIRKFSACWVPDIQGEFSLAGDLSNPPAPPPVPVKYIGILSRFYFTEYKPTQNLLTVLISGPEPGRTRFENIIFRQLKGCHLKTFIVRGLPDTKESVPFIKENIKIYNYLSAGELQSLLNETTFIIARSGYSTIMDLVKLKKNAILVPTPGQTEQEYLADYLHRRKWMYCVSQNKFDLNKALNNLQQSGLMIPEMPDGSLHEVLEKLLKNIP